MGCQPVHIAIPEYGQLPAAGLLDALSTARGTEDTVFTVSGYGLSYSNNVKLGRPNLSFRERLMAESTLVNLGSYMTDGYNLPPLGIGLVGATLVVALPVPGLEGLRLCLPTFSRGCFQMVFAVETRIIREIRVYWIPGCPTPLYFSLFHGDSQRTITNCYRIIYAILKNTTAKGVGLA